MTIDAKESQASPKEDVKGNPKHQATPSATEELVAASTIPQNVAIGGDSDENNDDNADQDENIEVDDPNNDENKPSSSLPTTPPHPQPEEASGPNTAHAAEMVDAAAFETPTREPDTPVNPRVEDMQLLRTPQDNALRAITPGTPSPSVRRQYPTTPPSEHRHGIPTYDPLTGTYIYPSNPRSYKATPKTPAKMPKTSNVPKTPHKPKPTPKVDGMGGAWSKDTNIDRHHEEVFGNPQGASNDHGSDSLFKVPPPPTPGNYTLGGGGSYPPPTPARGAGSYPPPTPARAGPSNYNATVPQYPPYDWANGRPFPAYHPDDVTNGADYGAWRYTPEIQSDFGDELDNKPIIEDPVPYTPYGEPFSDASPPRDCEAARGLTPPPRTPSPQTALNNPYMRAFWPHCAHGPNVGKPCCLDYIQPDVGKCENCGFIWDRRTNLNGGGSNPGPSNSRRNGRRHGRRR